MLDMETPNNIGITDLSIFNKHNENASALIFLHGYGSSKDDLIGLTSFFQELTNTIIFIPNAPNATSLGVGYQWFSIDISGNTINFDMCECIKMVYNLHNLIAHINQEYNIPSEKIGVFGFSQGAVMALGLALLLRDQLSSVVAHSGMFFDINHNFDLSNLYINRQQNILLIHGKQDEVVPFSYALSTTKFLEDQGVKFTTQFKDNLGHYIDTETMLATLNFFKLHLHS